MVLDENGVWHHHYQGEVLEGLGSEQVDHLLGLGFIAKVGSDDAVIVPGEEFLVPESIHPPERDSSGHVLVNSQPAEVDPPAKVAPKAEWVAFAVSQGADEAEAEGLTKSELIDLYS